MNLDRVSSFIGQQMAGSPLMEFLASSRWSERQGADGVCDFVFGNPHEPPLPEFQQALQKWAVAKNASWFAYKTSEPEACRVVASTLKSRTGLEFQPEDVAMTNGAFGALAVVLRAIAGPGDEVVFFSPPWFSYETLVRATGAEAVKVSLVPPQFDLDAGSLEKALTENTRAVILNTPQNPTGRVYQADVLASVADVLRTASRKTGKPIYVVSDEAYNRIVFSGVTFRSPVEFYEESFLVYTYGKTLLTPGERLGYIAIPPSMPEKDLMRNAIFLSQISTGWAFPNAVLQHAISDLEGLCIDITALEEKRDLMVGSLRAMGYELSRPEGTFYLLARSPMPDDQAFARLLAEDDVFVLPGSTVELPGWFRVSLTATKEMVLRSLPVFESAIKRSAVSAPAI